MNSTIYRQPVSDFYYPTIIEVGQENGWRPSPKNEQSLEESLAALTERYGSRAVDYIEAALGEHFSYAQSMGIMAAAVLVVGAIVIAAGPEAKGIVFGKQQP